MAIIFIGSIPGMARDRRRLRQAGVRGRMTYTNQVAAYGIGRFEDCEVGFSVLKDLIREHDRPVFDSFTAIDAESRLALSLDIQEAWRNLCRALWFSRVADRVLNRRAQAEVNAWRCYLSISAAMQASMRVQTIAKRWALWHAPKGEG